MDAISERDGELYVADTDVPLVGVLAGWERGETPDDIRASYPALSVEQIEAVFAYYCKRPEQAQRILQEYDDLVEQRWAEIYARDPEWHDRTRQRMGELRRAQRARLTPGDAQRDDGSAPGRHDAIAGA